MKRHEFKNPVPVRERIAEKWKKRFMCEKGYYEECAEYMAQRLIDLIDHMQYGYALIAFHKQGTIFKTRTIFPSSICPRICLPLDAPISIAK